MSHTNSTANYGLPQFLGSDKPAWLGDINPALSKIDQQMKTNADGVASATLSANTAQTSADNAKSVADGAVNSVNTLENTVSTQGNDINSLKNSVLSISKLFNLNDIQTKDVATDIPSLNNLVGKRGSLTLAQNEDGSVFKFYGRVYIENNSNSTYNIPKQLVAGMSDTYGFATGLFLKKLPNQAYSIMPYGVQVWKNGTAQTPKANIQVDSFYNSPLFVGSDGQIYIDLASTSNYSTFQESPYQFARQFYMPCIYFNSDFGDIASE